MKYDISLIDRKRMEKPWTVLEMSKRCKVPESTLRDMFKRGTAHPDTIKKAAKSLGIELSALIVEDVSA